MAWGLIGGEGLGGPLTGGAGVRWRVDADFGDRRSNVGGDTGSSGGGGGAMVGPGRDQVRKGWNCGANGGWWGNDGRPENQARRSTGVHCGSRGFNERPRRWCRGS